MTDGPPFVYFGRHADARLSTLGSGATHAACILLFPLLAGCGAADDMQAVERLKAGGTLVVMAGDKVDSANLLTKPMTDEFLEILAELVNVKTLNLQGSGTTDAQLAVVTQKLDPIAVALSNTEVTDQGLEAMSGFGRIQAVFLRDSKIGDEGMRVLGRLTTLQEIDLSNSQVTSAGLAHLTGLKKLKRLILDGTAVDDAGVEDLKALTSLGCIELRDTGITSDGASELGAAIPGLIIER